MTWDSLLVLDPRHPARRRDLADCQEMHRTVMSGYGRERAEAGVLWRLDGERVRVRSQAGPDWSRLPPGARCVEQGPSAPPAGILRLRLCAVVSVSSIRSDARRGQRRAILDPEERRAWLDRRCEDAGLRLLDATMGLDVVRHGTRGAGRICLPGVEWSLVATVGDAAAFARAWADGIGRGRAYGFGMLV